MPNNDLKQFKWNKRICTLIGNFPKESIITYESKYKNIPFLKSKLSKNNIIFSPDQVEINENVKIQVSKGIIMTKVKEGKINNV